MTDADPRVETIAMALYRIIEAERRYQSTPDSSPDKSYLAYAATREAIHVAAENLVALAGPQKTEPEVIITKADVEDVIKELRDERSYWEEHAHRHDDKGIEAKGNLNAYNAAIMIIETRLIIGRKKESEK